MERVQEEEASHIPPSLLDQEETSSDKKLRKEKSNEPCVDYCVVARQLRPLESIN